MPAKTKPFPLDLLFRALADPTRLRLLNLIADKEICVCFFVGILGLSQPKISRHLAYLRRAGIVAARRQGRWMHYRLLVPRDEAASAILQETLAHLRQRPDMQREAHCLVLQAGSSRTATRGTTTVSAAGHHELGSAGAPVATCKALPCGFFGISLYALPYSW